MFYAIFDILLNKEGGETRMNRQRYRSDSLLIHYYYP